jgi:NTP pyrophosphatase (non-canonical NTP hydrolase)
MLGLASETGSILNVYKKYLRDGIDLSANLDFLREELGDLLWYAAAIATSCGLDLDEIARVNLERTRDRYRTQVKASDFRTLPIFDADHSEHERFPRQLTIEFTESRTQSNRLVSRMRMISAIPNVFLKGPIKPEDGKQDGFRVGSELGDLLTDVGGAIVFDHFTGVNRFRYALGERIAGGVLLEDSCYFHLHDTGVFYRQR